MHTFGQRARFVLKLSRPHLFLESQVFLSQPVTFVAVDPNEVPCLLGLKPKLVMHVWIVIEMVGCCLQFSKYVMYATVCLVLE